MNTIDTSQILAQIRAMSAAAQGIPNVQQTNEANGVAGDFGSLLKQSIDGVNNIQQEAGRLSESFVMGDSSINLADVMIAKQKASIAFEATIQVRNKLLNAYKEIMAMQV